MRTSVDKIVDYFILSLLISLSIILTLVFSGNRPFQIITIVVTSLVYIAWGTAHHQREKTLYPQIILEYALFALLGTVLVIGLL